MQKHIVLDHFDMEYIHNKDIVTGWRVSLDRNPILKTLLGTVSTVQINGFTYQVKVGNSVISHKYPGKSSKKWVELAWILKEK